MKYRKVRPHQATAKLYPELNRDLLYVETSPGGPWFAGTYGELAREMGNAHQTWYAMNTAWYLSNE